MNNDARQLLTALHRDGTYGYWWVAEGRRSSWWEVGKATPIPSGRCNIYVGVHPVSAIPETNSRGEAAESIYVRSQINGISVINCLFAEYDAKDFAHDKASALAHIDTLAPPPSAVVDSGGGYHCYWLLNQPYPLATPDARRDAVKLQAAWVTLMGSDKASKDLARVLRVPGTYNHKYDPPRPVALLRMTEARYTIAELAALAAPFVEPDKSATIANGSMPAERYVAAALAGETAKVITAPEGQKHHQLFKSAAALGELAGAGMVDEQTVKELLFNAIAPRAADTKNAANTIRDGVAKGKTNPRQLPTPRTSANGQIVRSEDAPQAKPVGPVQYVVKDWKTNGVTLAELQYKEFQPERWVVQDILPEGACLLAAKPKAKKSWLSLGLGIAVAMGGKALGRLDVSAGRVLYLDLEGKQQRIQKRTRAILGVQHISWPENFHIYTKWPQGDEGIAQLRGFLETYPDTALVVIDVLGNFRRPIEKHEQPYQYDRDTVSPLNELLEQHHCAGILVHHTNKARHDDVMDSISGTTGLPSAVNTMWAMGRDPNDSSITIFSMRGRDLENDDPLALRWDAFLNMHVIEGAAAEVATSAERKAVLKVLSDDVPRTPKEIASELGKSVDPIKQLLGKLLNSGLVDKPMYGKYAIVHKTGSITDHSDHSDHSSHSDHSGYSSKSDRKSDQSDRQDHIDHSSDHSLQPHSDAVNKGKESKSDRSDRYIEGRTDLYIDEVETAAGVVFQIWDEFSQAYLAGDYATRDEAAAEAQRRMQ